MDITYLGESGFQLRGKDASLFVDPTTGPDRRANARAILMSSYATEPEFDFADIRVVSRPGEYEVSGMLIRAIRTSRASADNASDPGGMAYAITIDGVSICHLGRLSRVLTAGEVAEIGEADVVLLPVGGEETLAPNLAAQVVTQLNSKIIIPMLWTGEVERTVTDAPAAPPQDESESVEGEAESGEPAPPPVETVSVPSLDPFLKELGIRSLSPLERLSVTPTNQPATQQVTLLLPRA